MTTRQERRRQERQTKKQGNEIPIQGTVEMKEEYKDFVGIYDESVPVELCDEFVGNFEEAKKNRTIIDMTKENEIGYWNKPFPIVRKDEVALITPLTSTIYPVPPVNEYF